MLSKHVDLLDLKIRTMPQNIVINLQVCQRCQVLLMSNIVLSATMHLHQDTMECRGNYTMQ